MKNQRRFAEVSVALSFVLLTSQVLANPVGESVRAGMARFDRAAPGVLSIHQSSSRLIVNWRDFSIAAGETTRFIQPSASAVALNRVVTANPSKIFGTLEANGKVYLINQNGILVGKSGVINTRSFVASTLEISDASFLSGAKLKLSGDSDASVVNEGAIEAIGGDVFLIGRTVENQGSIRASEGAVGLGAGSEVVIVPSGRERLSVIAGSNKDGQAQTGVKNSGTIEAVSAELKAAGGNIYALAINNGGIIRATGVRREGGRVFLTSDGGNIENSGAISANNANGGGGYVSLAGGRNDATPSTVINSGTIEARGDGIGTKGGEVRMTGDHVGLFGASVIDVSGQSGGGAALLGGDYQGRNSQMQNAQRTFVGPEAVVRADALAQGNGGKVIVWADELTRFHGSISARGGASGGDGGFAEVSGKVDLLYRGMTTLLSPHGRVGTLLLDPKNIIVATDPSVIPGVDVTSGSAANVNTGAAFADNAVVDANQTFGIRVVDLVSALTGADVVLNANNNITFSDAVNASASANDLTLRAGGSIFINANLTLGGSFDATFNDSGADAANRDPGLATFTMAAGTVLTAPAGITIQAGTLAADSTGPTSVAANSGAIVIEQLTTASAAPVATSGSILIDGDTTIDINGAVTTGNATEADAGGGQTPQSGDITITAGGGVVVAAAGSVTTGSATLSGAAGGTDSATSGDIAITSGTGADVSLAGDVTTGSAAVTDTTGSVDTATTGAVIIGAGNAVVGAGRVATGNATLTSSSASGGTDSANSGEIQITTGAGGINLSATTALTTGSATQSSGGDEAASGGISLNSAGSINSPGSVLGIELGTASAASITQGRLTITTTGGSDASVGSAGTLRVGNVNVGAGDFNLVADEIDFIAGNNTVQGTGALTLQPATPSRGITLAGTEDVATLDLTTTDLNAIDATAPTFSSVVIGRATDGTGTLTLANDATFEQDVTLVGGSIVLNGLLTATGMDVTLTARTGNITDTHTGVDLVAGTLSATAQSGIDLDTTIGTLTLAQVNAAGIINIADSDGLIVTDANTFSGNITLSAAGLLNAVAVTAGTGVPADAGNGNVQLTTTGGGNVQVGDVQAQGDTVTITSAGAVTDGNAAGTRNVLAQSLSATAAGGTGISLDTDIATLTLASAGGSGDISINDLSGDLAVVSITATDDDVVLNSAGAITDGNADGTVNVTANTLDVTAAGGIDLDTTIGTLTRAQVSGAGGINIADSDGLIVTDAHTFNGNIILSADGLLDAVAVTAGTGVPADAGNGNVQLTTTSGGNVQVGDVQAQGDTVTITSAGAITDGNAAGTRNVLAQSLSATAAGGAGISLDTDIATLTLASAGGSGDISINDLSGDLAVVSILATGDDVVLDSAGAITDGNADGTVNVTAGTLSATAASGIDLDTTIGTLVSAFSTAGNININDLAGDLAVGTVTAVAGTVTLGSAGAITDNNAGGVNVVGSSLSATAAAGIDLDTDIGTLTLARLTGTGNVNIDDFGGNLVVVSVDAEGSDVVLNSAGTIIDGNADGTVNVEANTLDVTAASGIDLDTDITTLVSASSTSGDINIADVDELIANTVTATGGKIDLTAGDSTVATESDLTVGGITASGNITLTASRSVLDDGTPANITSSGGVTAVTATAGDIGTSTAPLDIDSPGGAVNLTANATTGGIHVNAVGGGNVQFKSPAGGARAIFDDLNGRTYTLRFGDDLTVVTDGNITAQASVELSVPGILTLRAGGNIGGSAASPLLIDAGTFAGSADNIWVSDNNDLSLGDITTTTGNLDVAAGGDLTVAGTSTVDAAVDVNLTAGSDTVFSAGSQITGGGDFRVTAGNDISVAAGSQLESTGGELRLEAGGNATISGNLTADGAADDHLRVVADTITLAGSPTLNANANSIVLAGRTGNGLRIQGAGTPNLLSRFVIYAPSARQTFPQFREDLRRIPPLAEGRVIRGESFEDTTPIPSGLGALENAYVFAAPDVGVTDPSLFIDIPVEVFQPVSIVFGDYDPTKFGEAGDLWMSSSELYEIERKAGKARKALPAQVNRSDYVPQPVATGN